MGDAHSDSTYLSGRDLVRGAAAGMAGGAAATLTMTLTQNLLRAGGGDAGAGAADPPPVRLAAVLSRLLLRRPLAEGEKAAASDLVQYGFGAALWLGGDETFAPLLGVADPPTRTPPSAQVVDLAGHLVYGVVTEAVRRRLRRR